MWPMIEKRYKNRRLRTLKKKKEKWIAESLN